VKFPIILHRRQPKRRNPQNRKASIRRPNGCSRASVRRVRTVYRAVAILKTLLNGDVPEAALAAMRSIRRSRFESTSDKRGS